MLRIFLLCISLVYPWVNFPASYTPVRIPVQVGENEFYILKYEKAGEHIAYAHVHENETSSLEAGLHTWNRLGGKLITLVHSFDGTKNRVVTFHWKKTTYEFDPNRIFTHDKELLRYNIKVIKGRGKVDDFILGEVQKLADIIWSELSGFHFILALHNNKNEAGAMVWKYWFFKTYQPESFSILSFVKKNDVETPSSLSCEDVYINPRINNSEFFLVTEKRDFSLLYKKRYNVVLQSKFPVDDGSMSVYAHKHHIRYVNSEAKMGKTKEQIEMLGILLDF